MCCESIRDLIPFIAPILVALVASSGFWSYILKKQSATTMEKALLLGLAHNHIVHECMRHIRAGKISQAEYDSIVTYLYKPYKDLGGNGLTIRLIEEIKKLPIDTENHVS